MIRLTLISALLLATLASCDDIPKQQSILPLPAITSLSQWNTEVLSTRSTAIVVLSLSSESNYDTMITDKCNSLNAQFSASSLPDALPFTCFTLDCSSSDQHKKICKPFLQTVPSIPAIVAFTGEPVLNPYQPADKAMGRPLVAAFNGVTDSPSEVERWLKRMLPNYVTLVDDSGEAGLSPTDKTHHEVIEDIPNVYLTTTKTHPSNMFKSLSYLFYGLANFHLISDVTIDSPSLRLDDVDYEGDVGNKEEIIDWLKARTVSPPEESRFMFKAKVDPTFARIGHAEELFSPVPPTTHYWVVVTVPSADASTSVDGRTAVDIQVSGFDEVVTAARGAMRCGVFIDPTVTKPTIKTYPMGENGEEPPPHQVGRSHKNVAVAYEELVDSLPIKIYPITGNNGGVMTFLQRNVMAGKSNKLALLTFTQKTYPPAFLKNIALVCDGIVELGLITNPTDDILREFQILDLPNILIVYDQPDHLRPEGSPDGVMLGQAVYEIENMGKYSFENVMKFILTCLQQAGLPGSDILQMRLIDGIGVDEEEFIKKHEKKDKKMEEKKEKEKFVGQLTNGRLEEMVATTQTSLNALVFVDGWGEGEVEKVTKSIEAAAESSSSVFSWSYVHATCNPDFAAAFDVQGDLLPAVVGWSAKAKRFVKYQGKELSSRELATWMDRVASGRIATAVLGTELGDIAFNDECVLDLGTEDEDFDMDSMVEEMRLEEEARKKEMEAELKREKEERDIMMEEKKKESEGGEKKTKKKKKKKKKKAKEEL